MILPETLYFNNDAFENVTVVKKINDIILSHKGEIVEPNTKLTKVEEGNRFVEFRVLDDGTEVGYLLHSEEVYEIRKNENIDNHFYGIYVVE